MQKRSYTVRTLVAFVVSFVGVIAFNTDLTGGPAPIDLPADMMQTIDSLPIRPLSPIEEALLHPGRLTPLPPEKIDTETLWLARAIFSESKRPEEQFLVAWVIRNRVETGYRGKRSYEAVITDPFQFSAFGAENENRLYYESLMASSRTPGWRTALRIAYDIRFLDEAYRPFSLQTRHFYSERSMRYRLHPTWAQNRIPVEIDSVIDIDQSRFRFFADIS